MRLIDAEKLQKHFENCIVECKNTNSYSEDFEIALSATKNQPTIETESVRYVKWIHGEEWIAHCSECGEEMLSTDISNYCPKCGVKMEEKMSFKIAEIKTLEAEIENLAYEKPFGEYAIFKNGFFKLNDKGIKIIHDIRIDLFALGCEPVVSSFYL